jgi:hypothetical protein
MTGSMSAYLAASGPRASRRARRRQRTRTAGPSTGAGERGSTAMDEWGSSQQSALDSGSVGFGSDGSVPAATTAIALRAAAGQPGRADERQR